MSSTKGKSGKNLVDPFELGREIAHSVKSGTVSEAQESSKTFLSQLFGMDFSGGAHNPSEVSNIHTEEAAKATSTSIEIFAAAKHHGKSEKSKPRAENGHRQEAAIDYFSQYTKEIVHSREKHSKSETNQMRQSIEEIKKELAKLIESSQVLKMEFAEVAVEQSIIDVGQYHLSFFDWMLTVIRSARQKVEDSGSWLGAVKGKGEKRGYWGMFKKHGTTFGLSGERAVATQVG